MVADATTSNNDESDLKVYEEEASQQKVQVNCGQVTTRGSFVATEMNGETLRYGENAFGQIQTYPITAH